MATFVPSGTWNGTVDAGFVATWTQIDWHKVVDFDSFSNPVTNIQARFRSAPSQSQLALATWSAWVLEPPAVVPVPDNRWLECQFFLGTADPTQTPLLLDVEINYEQSPAVGPSPNPKDVEQEDGEPWFCLNGRIFARLRSRLVDAYVYRKTEDANPYSNNRAVIKGSLATASATINVYVNDQLVLTAWPTDGAGNFSFPVFLRQGQNIIHVKDGVTGKYGEPIYVSTYHWGTIFCAYATVMEEIFADIDQARQNGWLKDHAGMLGGVLSTFGAELRDNFGQFITPLRRSGMTNLQYQALVTNALAAYLKEPAVVSLRGIFSGFSSGDMHLRDGYDMMGWCEEFVTFTVTGPPSRVMAYTAAQFKFYGRWYILRSGSITVADNSTLWLYVDAIGDTANELTLKTSTVFPVQSKNSFSEVVKQALIQTDTDGSLTGTVGEKFVYATRWPIDGSFTTATGSIVGSLSTASLVADTDIIDLGLTSPATGIGDVTIAYQHWTRPIILAKVVTAAGAVTQLNDNGRIRDAAHSDPTTNGVPSISFLFQESFYDMRLPGVNTLTLAQFQNMRASLRDVTPARTLAYEFDEGVTPNVYAFGSVV